MSQVSKRRGHTSPDAADDLLYPPAGPARGGKCWTGDLTYEDLATAVLVAHQRLEGGRGCLCGWGELGASHAQHVARVLYQVGALRT